MNENEDLRTPKLARIQLHIVTCLLHVNGDTHIKCLFTLVEGSLHLNWTATVITVPLDCPSAIINICDNCIIVPSLFFNAEPIINK